MSPRPRDETGFGFSGKASTDSVTSAALGVTRIGMLLHWGLDLRVTDGVVSRLLSIPS